MMQSRRDQHDAAEGGEDVEVGKLSEQARVLLELARKHEAELSQAGWPPARSEELQRGVEALEAGVFDRSGTFGSEGRQAGDATWEALAGADAFRHRLRDALSAVLRGGTVRGVSASAFEEGALGRTATHQAAYLQKIRPDVARLDRELAPHLGGRYASEQLDEVCRALERAEAVHDEPLSGQSDVHRGTREVERRVVGLVTELVAAGQRAFAEDPERARCFLPSVLSAPAEDGERRSA